MGEMRDQEEKRTVVEMRDMTQILLHYYHEPYSYWKITGETERHALSLSIFSPKKIIILNVPVDVQASPPRVRVDFSDPFTHTYHISAGDFRQMNLTYFVSNLTFLWVGSPSPQNPVQGSVQPEQNPADTEAQQQPKNQVHLLLSHTAAPCWKVPIRRAWTLVRDDVLHPVSAGEEQGTSTGLRGITSHTKDTRGEE